MDDEKIVKLNFEQKNIEKQKSNQIQHSKGVEEQVLNRPSCKEDALQKPDKNNVFQTNPIKKMLLINILNKKGKFKFKDLFR